MGDKLERFSPEWMEQLQRMVAAGQRFTADNSDKAAWDEFVNAGEQLGWIVPMDQKKPK